MSGCTDGASGGDGGADAGPADAGRPATAAELCDSEADPGPYPAPDGWEANAGPGAPEVSFSTEELYEKCAFLNGGPMDTTDHHNLLTMYDGYLLMPWAPEFGKGGLTFWDISEPCSPQVVGSGFSEEMRETHAIGFSSLGGRWAVVDSLTGILEVGGGGVQFWDVSDVTSPRAVSNLDVPTFAYPDAYANVTLSVFWQVPYVYIAGADAGVYIADATDPENPVLLGRHEFDPILRVGQVQAVGNLLIVTAAEGPRTALLDISDPAHPMPIPGGDFLATDGDGNPREAYFTNTAGGYVFYARKEGAGGVFVWDIRDPQSPAFAGEAISDGNGGYVFVKDDHAFVGESSFAAIYDISDLSDIREVTRLDLTGDLDTITPIGNLVVLSVDEGADPGEGSAIAPWQAEPDTQAPAVTWSWPADGATGVPTTSRVGVTFSEFVDVKSAWEGSVRLYETGEDPDATRVDGVVSAQEVIVNFHPRCPLKPATRYTLEIPAGGVVDFNGNAVAEPFTMTFTTGGG